MTTISERFDVPKVVGAVLGLELEVEGQNLPTARNIQGDLWKVVADGSLRGGCEYVFARPLGSARAKEALEDIDTAFKAMQTVTDYSFRTSTHCHVNVSNLEMDEVKAIITLYYLFEGHYMGYCAKSRQGNRFCLGMNDATGVVENVKRFFVNNDLPSEGRGKYAALNLVTLGKYGTLEFRALEGTNDWSRVFTWVRAIMALRKAGKTLGTVRAVLEAPIPQLIENVHDNSRLD